jgi:hypothetical protein
MERVLTSQPLTEVRVNFAITLRVKAVQALLGFSPGNKIDR